MSTPYDDLDSDASTVFDDELLDAELSHSDIDAMIEEEDHGVIEEEQGETEQGGHSAAGTPVAQYVGNQFAKYKNEACSCDRLRAWKWNIGLGCLGAAQAKPLAGTVAVKVEMGAADVPKVRNVEGVGKKGAQCLGVMSANDGCGVRRGDTIMSATKDGKAVPLRSALFNAVAKKGGVVDMTVLTFPAKVLLQVSSPENGESITRAEFLQVLDEADIFGRFEEVQGMLTALGRGETKLPNLPPGLFAEGAFEGIAAKLPTQWESMLRDRNGNRLQRVRVSLPTTDLELESRSSVSGEAEALVLVSAQGAAASAGAAPGDSVVWAEVDGDMLSPDQIASRLSKKTGTLELVLRKGTHDVQVDLPEDHATPPAAEVELFAALDKEFEEKTNSFGKNPLKYLASKATGKNVEKVAQSVAKSRKGSEQKSLAEKWRALKVLSKRLEDTTSFSRLEDAMNDVLSQGVRYADVRECVYAHPMLDKGMRSGDKQKLVANFLVLLRIRTQAKQNTSISAPLMKSVVQEVCHQQKLVEDPLKLLEAVSQGEDQKGKGIHIPAADIPEVARECVVAVALEGKRCATDLELQIALKDMLKKLRKIDEKMGSQWLATVVRRRVAKSTLPETWESVIGQWAADKEMQRALNEAKQQPLTKDGVRSMLSVHFDRTKNHKATFAYAAKKFRRHKSVMPHMWKECLASWKVEKMMADPAFQSAMEPNIAQKTYGYVFGLGNEYYALDCYLDAHFGLLDAKWEKTVCEALLKEVKEDKPELRAGILKHLKNSSQCSIRKCRRNFRAKMERTFPFFGGRAVDAVEEYVCWLLLGLVGIAVVVVFIQMAINMIAMKVPFMGLAVVKWVCSAFATICLWFGNLFLGGHGKEGQSQKENIKKSLDVVGESGSNAVVLLAFASIALLVVAFRTKSRLDRRLRDDCAMELSAQILLHP